MEMLYFIAAIIVFYLAVKLLSWPIKLIGKLIINGLLGIVLLFIANAITSNFGVVIGINLVTALIAGCLGVPGVIFLILFKMFM